MRYRIEFNPLVHASPPDVITLRRIFSDQGVGPTFEVDVLRQPYRVPKGILEAERRIVWAMEIPQGALSCAFRDSAAPSMRDQFETLAKAAADAVGASRKLLDPRRDFFTKDGDDRLFCRRIALENVRNVVPNAAFVNAVIAFLRAAEDDPRLVTGVPRPRRPQRTVEERIEHFGHATKGPAWTPEEDAVLRTWFGIRTIGEHAGHHAKLEDPEWACVLELLGGMRSKNAVKNRLTALNNQLRDRMLVNGYVPRDRLREYMQQAVGESPRRPPMRPYQRMRRVPREHRSSRRHDIPAPPGVAPTSGLSVAAS